LNAEEGAIAANTIQKFAIENTRLGIPLFFSEEAVHGHLALGATVFPVQKNMGRTWNKELVKEVAIATASEVRAQGAHIAYGPILDIAQDPRWSRVEETFGEDPYLAACMGVAVVKGFQGEALNTHSSVVSTLKHYVGYGSPEGGRNWGPTHVGEREMREIMLTAFQAAISAGALSVMSSYNEIDGIPCTCNPILLNDILRQEWGFEGFVVSDGKAIDSLCDSHHVAGDYEEAAALAINAGVDMNLWDIAYEKLEDAVNNQKVSIDVIDKAVRRILSIKFRLGLFENPYVEIQWAAHVKRCEKHRELALQSARESVVLLKNDRNLLPLSKNIGSIAIIGPNADVGANQLGDYSAVCSEGDIVTVLKGMMQSVSPETVVHYAKGCGIKNKNKAGFNEAIEAARISDVAVLVIGGSSARDMSMKYADTGVTLLSSEIEDDMDSGEGCDRSDLELAGVQLDLVREIHATGVPVIVVLIKGRPLSLNWIFEYIPAILDAGYPGEQGGKAIADIIFGDYTPSAKLTMSISKSVGHLPVYYNRKPTGFKQYLGDDGESGYSFGYGLSYTTFEYSNLQVLPARITTGETAVVSIDVTNIGRVKGEEIVQMYIRDDVCSVTRPKRELKGFEKVALYPGETKTVIFDISEIDIGFISYDMKRIVESGRFTVFVGGGLNNLCECYFEYYM